MAEVITGRKKITETALERNLEKNQARKSFLGNSGYSDFDNYEAAWEIPSHGQILTFSDCIYCNFQKYRLSLKTLSAIISGCVSTLLCLRAGLIRSMSVSLRLSDNSIEVGRDISPDQSPTFTLHRHLEADCS